MQGETLALNMDFEVTQTHTQSSNNFLYKMQINNKNTADNLRVKNVNH